MAQALVDFRGDVLYLDAVILVGYLDADSPWHAAASQIVRRRLPPDRSVELVTCLLTLDEAIYILLEELVARPPYGITRSRGRYLRRHPEVLKQLMATLAPAVQDLASILRVESVLSEDIGAVCQEMLTAGLLPRDAIHVAVMRRLGITAIASDDDDFERCQGIALYKP